ncbi:MAG: T9SS type A sorting domain-containing protein [Saprospiraceae bacterium]
MKPKTLTSILFLFFSFNSFAQDWMQFKGPDEVFDFQLHENYLWTISGSGLTRIDIDTETKTNWNPINSGIRDYSYSNLLVDTEGTVWLGGQSKKLMKFDGTSWDQINEINGDTIQSIDDIKEDPDGKIWIYGRFEKPNLYYFENGTYQEIASPDSTLNFFSGTSSAFGIDGNSHIWARFKNADNTYRILGEYTGTEWIFHDLEPQGIYLWNTTQFLADSQGNVYMLIVNSSTSNFLKYDGVDWEFMSFPSGTNLNALGNTEQSAYIDANDHIWIATWDNTFIEYDGQDWTTHELENIGLSNGNPDGLVIDDNNHQWIMYKHDTNYYFTNARKSLLHKFDGTETSIIDLSISGIPTNDVYNIIIDKNNIKWLASQNGLLKFDGVDWFEYPPDSLSLFYWKRLEGADASGNVWIQGGNSTISRFDGTSFYNVSFSLSNGDSIYNAGQNIAIGKNGEVYIASGESEIIIFDNGEITYLDGMQASIFGSVYSDKSRRVEVDTFGNLYNIGFSLNKYNGDSWTEIPLWTENPIGVSDFFIAPNQDIWVPHGFFIYDYSFKVYNGSDWENFIAPYKLLSRPVWDNYGNLWFKTDNGLCKKVGNDWICYNESNSPLFTEKINDFAFDESNNIWITFRDGGVIVFNESQIAGVVAEPLYSLTGFVYQDLNQNQEKDSSDLPVALQHLRLLPDSITTFSYGDGMYRFSVPSGDYEVEFLESTNWIIDDSPSVYSVSIDKHSIGNLDFRVGVFTAIFNQEKNELELKVFPNPTSGEIFISTTSSSFEKFQYKIFNSRGQIIQSGEINSNEAKNISMEKMPVGIYWIQVGDKKEIGISRFLKI